MRDFLPDRRAFLYALLVAMYTGLPTAHALKYRPRAEETLSHMALIHYGSPKKYVYITAANGIADPDQIPRGKPLRIPTVWTYRVKRGDTLSKLAGRFLKDESRYTFLIWMNKIRHPKDVDPGTKIRIPFVLRHRVQQGQTIVDVARRYYFRINKVSILLRRFNNKRTNALKPGETILVPIFDPEAEVDKVKERRKRYEAKRAKAAEEARERARQLADARQNNSSEEAGTTRNVEQSSTAEDSAYAVSDILDPDANQPDEQPTDPADAAVIQEATRLYHDGEYERARVNLERLLDNARLSSADEARAREILAFCLVALDQDKEAEHEFVRLLMVEPDRALDPVTTSPKIIEVFKRAQGAQ